MKRRAFSAALPAAAMATASVLALPTVRAQAAPPVRLRLFAGGQNQRPDIVRSLLDDYQRANLQVTVTIETGGATSDLQRQYLSTILNARDATLDLFLIDIVNPAQYLGAGWLEPLNAYLGDPDTALAPYLEVYRRSNVIDGRIAALPAFADAMFMFYRRDLLERHGLREPATWDELSQAARRIQQAEAAAQPRLQGLSIQGAPIEGTVCTFLLPYWSQGREFQDARGRLTLDRDAAIAGLRQWLALIDAGVVKRNVAEVKTADTVNEFKAGNVVFAVNWSWAWERFQSDADSRVKGRVGVMPLPAMSGGQSVTCVGGWQWAVSAFSRHKPQAARLAQFLASPEASRRLAIRGALLPSQPAVYRDPEVLRAVPWFADAARVVVNGRSRPQSRDYGQVSDMVRTSTSAVLAGVKSPERAVAEIESRMRRVMR
jgi:multiple sugar transport system substrate-binding protein